LFAAHFLLPQQPKTPRIITDEVDVVDDEKERPSKFGPDGRLENTLTDDIIDEWTPEIEELKNETKKPVKQ